MQPLTGLYWNIGPPVATDMEALTGFGGTVCLRHAALHFRRTPTRHSLRSFRVGLLKCRVFDTVRDADFIFASGNNGIFGRDVPWRVSTTVHLRGRSRLLPRFS